MDDQSEGARGAKTTRRSVLLGSGLLGMLLAGPDWELWAAAMHHGPPPVPAGGPPLFDAADFADLEAITARIIPTDETPGAREAGAAKFIDRALATFFAPMTAEFRAGFKEFQQGVHARYPEAASFAALPVAEQDEWLRSIEKTAFFVAVRQLTVLGTFTSPAYGGNRDGAGWQIIGFLDQHAFQPPFGYYDRDYPGFVAP